MLPNNIRSFHSIYNSALTGNRLKELRDSLSETQDDVAQLTNRKTRQSVAAWEHGESDIPVLDLFILSRHFGVSSDYLLGLSDFKTNDDALSSSASFTGLSANAIRILSCAVNRVDSFINNLVDSWQRNISLSDFDLTPVKKSECCSYVSDFISLVLESPRFFDIVLKYGQIIETLKYYPSDSTDCVFQTKYSRVLARELSDIIYQILDYFIMSQSFNNQSESGEK